MKTTLVFATLLFSSVGFAQSLDVTAMKSLMQQRKATLEQLNQGMSRKMTTVSRVATEKGPCEITSVAIQTMLKVQGENMIVFSKENYTPAATPACAGFGAQSVAVVFYDDKPTLASDLKELDENASDIVSLSKAGEIVTMVLKKNVELPNGTARPETITVKYDMTKPSFKNTLLVQDSTSKVTIEDMSDVDINSISLKDVLLCESADSDNCQQGDWSDILY